MSLKTWQEEFLARAENVIVEKKIYILIFFV